LSGRQFHWFEVGLALEKILHDIDKSARLLQLWHVRQWQFYATCPWNFCRDLSAQLGWR